MCAGGFCTLAADDAMQISSPDQDPAGRDGRKAVRVGDRVRVRRQRWRVSELRQYDTCTVLTLVGVGPSNRATERQVIAPFDLVEPLARSKRLGLVGPRRWRRAARALIAGDGPAAVLQAARSARIDLLPHQLEPVIAIVRGLASRVLIADEVGLGKTIQAGLIVAELSARGVAERVLIVTPAGLREQWAAELAGRFDIDAAVVDMRAVRQRAARFAVGVNPWRTVPIAIASVDYVKRPEVLPAVRSCPWDVVIVDEAHNVGPGSDRRDAVAALCGLAPYVILLTATPHSGDRQAFVSLCGLGARGGDPILAFRRSRREVVAGAGRRIHRLLVRPTAEEARMHRLLERFTRVVRAERGDDCREVWLTLATLHKRGLSSARSLERTIARRLAALPAEAGHHQLGLPLDDGGGELDGSDEAPAWTSNLLGDAATERGLLVALADAARGAARRETKLAALDRLLARLHAIGEPAIVFTEYRDTLLHVRDSLPCDCAVLHGGLGRNARRAELDDFLRGRRPILLATDAGGEGLNLHQACRVVVNLELPWNPMRLEQRIGRVDRIGQLRTVHAFHLIARHTEEMRLLDRLRARIARAREDIDVSDPLGSSDAAGDEEAVARHVLGGGASEPTRIAGMDHLPDGRPASEGVTGSTLELRREAAIEHARLVGARALVGADRGPHESEAATLVTLSRRSATRSALASRILVLTQRVIDDSCGRRVASHLTPVMVDLPRRLLRKEATIGIGQILRDLGRLEPEAGDPALSRWTTDTVRAHGDFWATRLRREAAMARTAAAAPDQSFQPGLFDRRANRDHLAVTELRAEVAGSLAQRLAAVERGATIEPPAEWTVLVLVP